MESGGHSELEPGCRALDPASAVHLSCSSGCGPQPLSVKSDAGTPNPHTGVCRHQSERTQCMLRFPPAFGDLAFP